MDLELKRKKILKRLSRELGSHRLNFHGILYKVSRIRREVRKHTELGDEFVSIVA
jgi:hypothetical protein